MNPLDEVFSDRLDRFLAAGTGEQVAIRVSETPPVMLSLGVKQLPVVITSGTVRKVLHRKHNIPVTTFKKVASHIANPIMVFDSATQPGSLVVMTGLKDEDESTIVAALLPSGRYGRHEVNVVVSVYGKDRNGWFIDQMENGRLRYIDKKKALIWFMTLGLQLPKVRGTDQGTVNILKSEAVVKQNEAPQPDISSSAEDGAVLDAQCHGPVFR